MRVRLRFGVAHETIDPDVGIAVAAIPECRELRLQRRIDIGAAFPAPIGADGLEQRAVGGDFLVDRAAEHGFGETIDVFRKRQHHAARQPRRFTRDVALAGAQLA